jgi:hypothetical protein
MKVGFWNVQRLGDGTSEEKKRIVADVIDKFFDELDVELFVLCEVMSDTVVSSILGNEHEVEKLEHRPRRSKKRTSAALGYSLITTEGLDVTARKFEVPTFSELFGQPNHRKGSADFYLKSKRHILTLSHYMAGWDLYFYHANAESLGGSRHKVAWAAEALRHANSNANDEVVRPFVLIGDLNCQPTELRNCMGELQDIVDKDEKWLKGFQVSHGLETHTTKPKKGKAALQKTYDYAIGTKGKGRTIEVKVIDTRFIGKSELKFHPDHLPIVVKFV